MFLSVKWNMTRLGGPAHGKVTKNAQQNYVGGMKIQGLAEFKGSYDFNVKMMLFVQYNCMKLKANILSLQYLCNYFHCL